MDTLPTSRETSHLTHHRAAVLESVTQSGATRSSPLRLHGQAFKAGLWLYEHDLLGMTSEGFYPISTSPPRWKRAIGTLPDGSTVELYVAHGPSGWQARCTNQTLYECSRVVLAESPFTVVKDRS